MPALSAPSLARHFTDYSPRGIASTMARLMRSGELSPDDRLPTVRDLARVLGVSPGTVSAAWQALASVGLIVSRGRAGTYVLPEPAGWLPPRYREMADATSGEGFDLSSGTPDPALLPPLRRALIRAADHITAAQTDTYLAPPVLPELERLLRNSWPFVPQRLTVVDGAMDALGRTLEQVAGFGDRIAVENPGFPPVFDLLDQLGLVRVPLSLDSSGVRPDSLEAALREGVRAVLVQPRAHNPTGVSMTATRVRELATVLRTHGPSVMVIEDDHAGQIASTRDISIGSALPDRVIHVRSYSKSHGPDLRIAAVGGPASVIDGLVARRMLGPSWTSRLLQHVIVDLLTDGESIDAVSDAQRIYHARRRSLMLALAVEGVELPVGSGINVWLPVHDEATALARLAAAGIRVAPGTPFMVQRDGSELTTGHVRLTLSSLPDDLSALAQVLAVAAAP